MNVIVHISRSKTKKRTKKKEKKQNQDEKEEKYRGEKEEEGSAVEYSLYHRRRNIRPNRTSCEHMTSQQY